MKKLPDRERWRPIAEVLDRTLELPAEERRAFLDRACARDPELRREVETYLEADSRAEGFLEAPLDEYLAKILEEPRETAASGQLPYEEELGPYQLVREIGRGGMGVVYEGWDRRLDRRVALKLLPAEWSHSLVAKERFVREAKAAAALDHPNLCPVYDVGESDDGRLFIVMPFYEGETLERKIARGPLPPESARELAIQVARGLARAHRAGIVHRDVKPSNVLVTERGEAPPGRARILDFGIARIAGDTALTRAGVSPGTPAYMSPEQVSGGSVDARADVWALGVLLYEMLSGRRPFAGDDESAVRHAILHRAPETLDRELPEALVRVMRRALEKEPAVRYQRIEDLLADLEPGGRRRGLLHRRWHQLATALLLAVLVAIGGWWSRHRGSAGRDTAPSLAGTPAVETAVPVVGVLPFVNRTGDPRLDWYTGGIARLIADGLVPSRHLRVVSGPRLEPLSPADELSELMRQATERKIETVLVGEILPGRRGLILAARLIRTADGRLLASRRVDDLDPAGLLEATDEIAREARKGLGVPLTETVTIFAADFASENPQAYELYVRGLEAFSRYRYDEAERAFAEAVEKAPDFTMARYRLAHVEAVTGHTSEALENIRRAAGETQRLGDRDARYVHAMEAYISRRYEDAAQAYRQILDRYPYDTEARHSLARLLYATRRYREALEVLDVLSRLEPENPILWSHSGAAHLALGNLHRAVQHLERYVALEPGSANGHHSLGNAYRAQEELDLAAAEYAKALEVDPAFHFATVTLAVTDVLRGRRKEAEARLEALAGDHEAAPRHRIDAAFELASLYRSRGRFRDAAEVLAGLEEILAGEKIREAMALAIRGSSRMELGDEDGARRLLDRAVERSPGAPTRYLFARGLFELREGRFKALDETVSRILEHALPDDEPDRTEEKAAAYLRGMGHLARGDADSALEELTRAVVLEGYEYVIYRLGLARASLAAGKLHEAMAAARESWRELDPNDPRLDLELCRVRALLVLAQVQEALGRPREAAKHARRFLTHWADADPGLGDLAEARRLARAGDPADLESTGS